MAGMCYKDDKIVENLVTIQHSKNNIFLIYLNDKDKPNFEINQ